MCNKRYISKPKIKKWDQLLERLIPSCRSFLLPVFLAEFPSGAWMLTMSAYLPQFSSPHEKEPKEGHLPIFKWCRWPNVDGANSLSWNFIGIPRKPSYSASFSWLNSHLVHGYPPCLLILPGLLRSDLGGGAQCLLSFGRTGRRLRPT